MTPIIGMAELARLAAQKAKGACPPRKIASPDALLPGGIPAGTMAAVIGPSGPGKTTVGLHFLSASSSAEPGLRFGCYESPARLRRKAETMGLDLAGAEQRGDLELLWHPVGEHILDPLAHKLLAAIRRRGVKRLVIDGIAGFQQSSLEQDRIVRFWSRSPASCARWALPCCRRRSCQN